MRRMAGGFAAVAFVLALGLPMARAGGRDRFPGFAYTSPEAIEDAQGVLVALKYLGPAKGFKRGDWDAKTQEALRDFQRDHFLRPDGRLDRDTMAVLMSHKPPTKDKR